MSTSLAAEKQHIPAALRALVQQRGKSLSSSARSLYTDDVAFNAFCPVDECTGVDAAIEQFWQPLVTALPDLERRDELIVAGEFQGQNMIACLGHWQGHLQAPLFEIPATGRLVAIRYGEVHLITESKISASYIIADMLDLMRQVGVTPIAPSLGDEIQWPGPAVAAGIDCDRIDPTRGASTLHRVREMHQALGSFDGKSLDSMPHATYWHQDFMWYGPSGIGTTRGLDGFRVCHQIPFLRAFPDRVGGQHYVRIGDGPFAVTGGWPSVTATHAGDGWLAMPATGKRVGMRVMDFYRCDENGLIVENWVPIDIIDILRQLGVDVFGRLREITRTTDPSVL
ncbi:MAG: ester cyclase [Pseudomonadota bacterium]